MKIVLTSLQALRPKKRLFLGLLLAAEFFVALVLYAAWRISYLGLENIFEYLPAIVGAFLIFISTFSFGAVCNMVLAVKGFPTLKLFHRYSFALIKFLFPAVVRIGKIFGIKRRQIEGSFVAVSNLIFMKSGIKVPANKLLVLSPHCLQLSTCPHKITRDPNNCKRCGGCNIGDLMKLSEELGFTFFVATGGTLARQVVKKNRPQAVLAIACERDLMSGIQDVYPLPAVGVLNIRPNGPCNNTRVDMDEVRRALEQIIDSR
ncbi:MAG: DUF116 domain-containing protein [Selenomonadaceae bacterium]|nr:DUF116 domain-containing protein [Selenomonadaceae bacterium]